MTANWRLCLVIFVVVLFVNTYGISSQEQTDTGNVEVGVTSSDNVSASSEADSASTADDSATSGTEPVSSEVEQPKEEPSEKETSTASSDSPDDANMGEANTEETSSAPAAESPSEPTINTDSQIEKETDPVATANAEGSEQITANEESQAGAEDANPQETVDTELTPAPSEEPREEMKEKHSTEDSDGESPLESNLDAFVEESKDEPKTEVSSGENTLTEEHQIDQPTEDATGDSSIEEPPNPDLKEEQTGKDSNAQASSDEQDTEVTSTEKPAIEPLNGEVSENISTGEPQIEIPKKEESSEKAVPDDDSQASSANEEESNTNVESSIENAVEDSSSDIATSSEETAGNDGAFQRVLAEKQPFEQDEALVKTDVKVISEPSIIGKFWHLTDFHLEPDYKTNCPNGQALGDYMCDSPLGLVTSAIAEAGKVEANPDFIIWTGDAGPHRSMNETGMLAIQKTMVTELRKAFPSVMILPVIGNHDVAPASQMSVLEGDSTRISYLTKLAEIWQDMFDGDEEKQRFSRYGYHSRRILDSTSSNQKILLKLLSLNGLIWYSQNQLAKPPANSSPGNDYDPLGQFAWMTKELTDARTQGYKVILASHFPPGASENTPLKYRHLYPEMNQKWLQILVDFADCVSTTLVAHEHTDSFRVVLNQQKKPVGTVFLTPAVTSYHLANLGAMNPRVRLYSYERVSGQLASFEDRILRLNDTESGSWTSFYDFKTSYQLTDMSAMSLWWLLKDFSVRNDIWQAYYNREFGGRPHENYATCRADEDCFHYHQCAMRYLDLGLLDACLGRDPKPASLKGLFWQFTDIHLDPNYERNCPDSAAKSSLGSYDFCDSPLALVQSAFREAGKHESRPDFVLWTGDGGPHDISMGQDDLARIDQNLTAILMDTFDVHSVVVLPVVGNHDVNPANLMSPAPEDQKRIQWCTRLAGLWFDLFDSPEEMARFAQNCYHARKLVDPITGHTKLMLLGLNGLIWYANNPNAQPDPEASIDSYDPLGQFAWLESHLVKARQEGYKVLLASHFPPGASENTPLQFRHLYPVANEKLLSKLVAYADVISSTIVAHQHTDSFRVVMQNETNPVGTVILGPSLTSFRLQGLGSMNPRIRLYSYNTETGLLNSYQQYMLDLSQSQLEWASNYNFIEAYQVPSISPLALFELLQKFREDDSLWQAYWQRELGQREHENAQTCLCHETCFKHHYCAMSQLDLHKLDVCIGDENALCRSTASKVSLILVYIMCCLFILTVSFFVGMVIYKCRKQQRNRLDCLPKPIYRYINNIDENRDSLIDSQL